ncbi:MAG: hypothetical protein DI562_03245 [Stenotrophomonas acidaminiphila]|nr:MAG: hypothetical protein DI562_03245 [Stenotrophomonas acidaminiphila]
MGRWVRKWFLEVPAGARQGHLLTLDGLRGLAVLIVLGSHFSNAGWLRFPNLSGTGKSGVYLFFVLSAYLLAHAMLAQPLAGMASGRYWANYALRRVLRIWPLYLVLLLGSWCLTRAGVGIWHYQMDTAALFGHLALRQGMSSLWSIPVEFIFYFWLPFIAAALLALRQLPGGRWWGAGLLVALVFWARWRWPAAEAPTGGVKLGFYLVLFLCGIGAAWVQLCWSSLSRERAAWRVVAWVLLGVLVLVTPSVWVRLAGGGFNPELNHRWFTAFGIGWGLLILALLWGGGALARLFASAPMRLMGVVSYSVYLWHMPVLQVADALGVRGWGGWGLLTLLVAVLLVSMGSFLLFERPWRDVRLVSAPTRTQVNTAAQ